MIAILPHLHPSAPSLSSRNPYGEGLRCRICGHEVSIESAKTDEFGLAVHEHCYCAKVASRHYD
jgi:hypothetical protein